jgi:hypothetical protein
MKKTLVYPIFFLFLFLFLMSFLFAIEHSEYIRKRIFESSISKNIEGKIKNGSSKPLKISTQENKFNGELTREIEGVFQIESSGGNDGYMSSGSGFFVQRNGKKYLVSVEHNFGWNDKVKLFRNSEQVYVKLGPHVRRTNEDIFVALAYTDEKAFDLFDRLNLEEIPLHWDNKKDSTKIFIVNIFGYPSNHGFRIVKTTFSKKIVFLEDGLPVLLAEDVAGSGFSGGPWIERKSNKVIGIHSKKINLSGKDLSGGVPVNVIHDMIDVLEKGNQETKKGD